MSILVDVGNFKCFFFSSKSTKFHRSKFHWRHCRFHIVCWQRVSFWPTQNICDYIFLERYFGFHSTSVLLNLYYNINIFTLKVDMWPKAFYFPVFSFVDSINIGQQVHCCEFKMKKLKRELNPNARSKFPTVNYYIVCCKHFGTSAHIILMLIKFNGSLAWYITFWFY